MNDIYIDKEILKRIIARSYNESKEYKTLNSSAVAEIIKILKEELKNDED